MNWEERRLGPNGRGREYLGGGGEMKKGVMAEGGKGGEA